MSASPRDLPRHGTGSRRGTAGPRTRRERHRGPLGRAGDDRPADPSSDRGGPAYGRAARASGRRRHRHRRDGHRQHHRGGGARGGAHRRARGAHDRPRDRARRRRVAAQGRGGRGGRRAPPAARRTPGRSRRWPTSVASRSPASSGSSSAAPRRASPSCSTATSPGPRRSSPSSSPRASRRRLLAGHRSVEPGHRIVLDRLGLEPILDLDLRLGEGTGAALAMQVLASAVAIRDGMATFASAGSRIARDRRHPGPARRDPLDRRALLRPERSVADGWRASGGRCDGPRAHDGRRPGYAGRDQPGASSAPDRVGDRPRDRRLSRHRRPLAGNRLRYRRGPHLGASGAPLPGRSPRTSPRATSSTGRAANERTSSSDGYGEAWADLVARAEPVIVVSHGGPLRVIAAPLAAPEPARWLRVPLVAAR